MSTQAELNEYFSTHWDGTRNAWYISNVKNIASMVYGDRRVLDVGCGLNSIYNEYLSDVEDLTYYAFDPAFDTGDRQCTLEEIELEYDEPVIGKDGTEYPQPRRWYTILCLGSINFGSEEHIKSQITKLDELLEPGGRIIWRQNPGIADHDNEECRKLTFYPWSQDKNYELAQQFGMHVTRNEIDYRLVRNLPSAEHRIFSIWEKPNPMHPEYNEENGDFGFFSRNIITPSS